MCILFYVGVDESVVALLQDGPKALNMTDNFNKAPITYARNPKMVHLFTSFDAPGLDKYRGCCDVLLHYLDTNPENAKALMDSKITTNGKDFNDSELVVIYDFDIFKPKTTKQMTKV